tara:strand:+ start:32 stop:454 length:423 start_codon:yes stop_codon:yes gene_type:complete
VIKYNLKCKNDHEFESWFSNSKEFEKLKKKRLLDCIYCSSNEIEKSIMSPMISNKRTNETNLDFFDQKLGNDQNKLIKLRQFVENNFEFVGENFSKKVREVYYDKKSKKSIYGNASEEEREELAEEGIDLLSIPWVDKDN